MRRTAAGTWTASGPTASLTSCPAPLPVARAASTPFLFFTDFEPDLGRKVVEGRRREFRDFPGFGSPGAAERIPDPQADQTFEASRLRWSELSAPRHANSLELHRTLLALRAQ